MKPRYLSREPSRLAEAPPALRKPVEKDYGAKSTYGETAYERRRREAKPKPRPIQDPRPPKPNQPPALAHRAGPALG